MAFAALLALSLHGLHSLRRPHTTPLRAVAANSQSPPSSVHSSSLAPRDTVQEQEQLSWSELDAWLEGQQEEDKEGWSGEDKEGWSELDAWLEGQHESQPEPRQRRARWTATAAGHIHEHFHPHNTRMREWAALGASERLVDNLARLGYDRPSVAQSNSFAPIAAGENVLLADDHGAGKTLALVAPLVQKLWDWEEEFGRTGPGEVRALIIVPTNDLAQQILGLAREVARRSIRASVATGGHSWRTQCERLAGGLDLLVGTMGRVYAHLHPREPMAPSFDVRSLRAVAVDEACSLYQGRAPSWLVHETQARWHDSRNELLQELPLALWGSLLAELEGGCSKVMLTSALPDGVEEQIRSDLGASLVASISKGLHRTRAGVAVTLVDCSSAVASDTSIFDAKLSELRGALARSRHALVLCSTAASCERLERALRSPPEGKGEEAHPTVLLFHGSQTPKARAAALKAFRKPAPNWWEIAAAERTGAAPARVLLATGRSARGLDLSRGGLAEASGTDRALDAVVLFDFAPDAKAYLSRVGFALRGSGATQRAANVTALAIGAQLPFAKALLARDARGNTQEVRDLRGEAEQRGVERPSRRRGRAEKEEGW